MTRIKICCIKNYDEALIAVKAGVDALGLVSEMPSGPGVISIDEIEKIVKAVPPYVATNLLTSKSDFDEISMQLKKCRCNTLQIVDRVDINIFKKIRDAFPLLKIVQVVHVTDEKSVDEAKYFADYADAILLDSGNQNLKVKELGGTGRTHDWQLSRKIREMIKVPLILAGGLNPDSVKRAIIEVEPFAVDVCSGVRTDDKLDENKLTKFVEAVLEAL